MDIIDRWEENPIIMDSLELEEFAARHLDLFNDALSKNNSKDVLIHNALYFFAEEALKFSDEGNAAARRQLKAYRAAKEG